VGVDDPPVLAPGPLAGFSFMEKYQSPAIATMQAPMSILRTSGLISVSSLQSNMASGATRGSGMVEALMA
jgi:hypothetical protein